jgi:hypothetical protein
MIHEGNDERIKRRLNIQSHQIAPGLNDNLSEYSLAKEQ